MSGRIDIGDRVKITVVFAPETGNTVPSQVTLAVKAPDGATSLYTSAQITAVATDSYRYNFLVTQSGKHYYRWASSGTVDAAEEGSFVVVESNVLTT